MATITLLGTSQNKASSDPFNPTGGLVTLSAGDALIVCLSYDYGGTVVSVKWNNISLTKDIEGSNTGGVVCSIWSLPNVASGASQNILVDWGTIPAAMAGAAYQIVGLVSGAAIDKSASAIGTGTSGTAGPTATLTQADEVIIGCVGGEDGGDAGDLVGVWTAGAGNVSGNEQKIGTTGGGDASNVNVYSAAEIVAATTAQTAKVTGLDNIDWPARLAREQVAGGTTHNMGAAPAGVATATATLTSADKMLPTASALSTS